MRINSKSIYLVVIYAMLFIVITIPYPTRSTLPKRQDPNMDVGESINIDLEKFVGNLEALKALNDSIVDAYVTAIEKAIDASDYETANELLKQLQNYLEQKYGDKLFTENPDLAKNLSLVMSTKNITDSGASVDLIDFIEKYAELLNSTSLMDLVEKIKYNPGDLSYNDLEKIYKLISELQGESQGSIELPELPENFTQGIGQIELPPISELPPLPEAPMPEASLLPPSTIQPISSWSFLQFLAISILIFVIFLAMRYRRQVYDVVSRGFKRIMLKSRDYLDLIIGTRIDDPIINLYRRLLFYLRLLGYRRRHYETLREFVSKIRDRELKLVVYKATEAYEDRVYGNKTIEDRKLREIRSLINKIFRGI